MLDITILRRRDITILLQTPILTCGHPSLIYHESKSRDDRFEECLYTAIPAWSLDTSLLHKFVS